MVQILTVSRLTIEGEKIVKRIFQRDKAEGGVSLETVGPQGSGKSSLDLHIASRIMDKFPGEILFYRDSIESPVQFNRVENYQIYVENGLKLKFRDYDTNSYFHMPVTMFNDFDELYEKALPCQLNVVYFIHEYTWIDFLNYLRRHMHHGSGWKSVFLEEYEDIAPQYAGGKWWKKNLLYSKNAKNIRKGLVSTFANTQSKADVSHFIRNKLMMRSYLRGAKVDQLSPIVQGAIDKLRMGEAMIDFGSSFGKITFKAFPPKKIFEVEKVIPYDLIAEEKKDDQDQHIKHLEKKIEKMEHLIKRLEEPY